MKSFKQFNEAKVGETTFTFEEIQEAMKTGDMGIVSAYMGNSLVQDKAATQNLKRDLGVLGYSFERAIGQYKDFPREISFLVLDTEGKGGLPKKLFKLGEKYQQESIYVHLKGKPTGYFWYIADGKKEAMPKIKWGQRGEGYTKIKAGYFTF
jgi:hypothetical protein